MPAVSKKQQRFFGMVRAAQKGEMENPSSEVLDVASDISMKDAKKFAKTKHKGLPEKKVTKEETKPNPYGKRAVLKMLIKSVAERERSKAGVTKEDVNEDRQIKKIVKQLRKSVKSHAKQADTLEKKIEEEKKGDHEPEMIRSQLKTAARASKRIEKHSKKKENFKAWVQSKITKASDYLDTAADYLDSKDMKEESNPRIPRKKGQPAGSKKHSDLYTDENPKGTIHGLGFKDVATAKASVSKIRGSSRSHAHKIQAAVAMEQRAREMGKTSEAAIYRKYINSMKKKTKKMNEEVKRDEYGDPIGGPKISKKQKAKNLSSNTPDEQHTTTTSEQISYREFTKKSREVAQKVKQDKQKSREMASASAYKDKKGAGIKFYDKKGAGRIKAGKKIYD